MIWQLRDRILTPGCPPLVMGIVNVTPDSFSDGGRFFDEQAAVTHALDMVKAGADLLDIGGESTRPGATPVPLDEELRRVIPVVKRLVKECIVPLSIDTSKAEVARQALEAGAHVINDVTALTGDPDMAAVVRTFNAGVVLMHMKGTPQTMQIDPHYDDVVCEVGEYLEARLHAVEKVGIDAARVALDPGIGFGQTYEHSIRMVARLGDLRRLGRPICLGVSRKGFLGKITGRQRSERMAASLAVACYALAEQSAQILRVHDVAETRDAVAVCQTLIAARGLAADHR
jgi:dihydropteroate synthase